jgi:phosphate uptake regulator
MGITVIEMQYYRSQIDAAQSLARIASALERIADHMELDVSALSTES